MTEKLCKQDTHKDAYLQASARTYIHTYSYTYGGPCSRLSLPSALLQLGVALCVRFAVPCHVNVSLLSCVQHYRGCLMSVYCEAEKAM